MDSKQHWEKIHSTKPADGVSWYRPHLDLSLSLIEQVAPSRSASIVDVGGGQSSLAGDLLARGYENLTVLDISQTAIERAMERLGKSSSKVHWMDADVLEAAIEQNSCDIWHDRAVFHFLTDAGDRRAYARKMMESLKAGGHAVISTFALDGPDRCSGLNVVRYDTESLDKEFGPQLKRMQTGNDLHRTPTGIPQNFVYAVYRAEK
jgi:2-polyprenyl-3-methyl-5-hydroxy-6-metoxy-1,4-benzoquinol methylase